MAVKIPTYNSILTNTTNTLKSELGITNTFLGRVFLLPLAIVISGLIKLLYLQLSFVQKQLWVTSADTELQGGKLEEFARTKGLTRFQGSQGIYLLDVTGQSGGTIDAGTTYKRVDLNVLYQVDTPVTLLGTTGTVEVRCLSIGTAFLLEVGDTLTSTIPIINVDSQSTVNSIIEPPTDPETDQQFRLRIIAEYNTSPNGGSPSDYDKWSKDIVAVGEPPIRKTFAYGDNNNVGSLLLFVENQSTDNTPQLPTQGQLDAIYTDNVPLGVGEPLIREGVVVFDPDTTLTLEERGRMPVPGPFIVTVSPISIQLVTVIITNLTLNTGENATNIQNTINAALIAYTYTVRPFVAGADDPNAQNDVLRSSDLSAVAKDVLFGRQGFKSLQISIDGGTTFLDEIIYTFGLVPNLDIQYVIV